MRCVSPDVSAYSPSPGVIYSTLDLLVGSARGCGCHPTASSSRSVGNEVQSRGMSVNALKANQFDNWR
jgi:hypothetical protein